MATKTKQKGFKSDVLSAELSTAAEALGNLALEPKLFKSGKVGMYGGGAQLIAINGRKYKAQVSVSIVCHHSDEWPEERPQPRGETEASK